MAQKVYYEATWNEMTKGKERELILEGQNNCTDRHYSNSYNRHCYVICDEDFRHTIMFN